MACDVVLALSHTRYTAVRATSAPCALTLFPLFCRFSPLPYLVFLGIYYVSSILYSKSAFIVRLRGRVGVGRWRRARLSAN